MKQVLLVAALILFVIALLVLVAYIFLVKLLDADMKDENEVSKGSDYYLNKENCYESNLYVKEYSRLVLSFEYSVNSN